MSQEVFPSSFKKVEVTKKQWCMITLLFIRIQVLSENENQGGQVRQLQLHHEIKCLCATMFLSVQALQGPPE